MTYPPMPWRLVTRGVTLCTLHPVPVERARERVPAGLRLVTVWPGYTLGGLFLAEYGPGSDLEYNELIVAGAMVWHGGWPCPWITHIYVDSEASVRGGRELMGVPKLHAPFTRQAGGAGRVVVGDPADPVCAMEAGPRVWLWRQALRLTALHADVRDPGGAVVSSRNRVEGRGGITRVGVAIPRGSPLHPLGLGRPLLALCARDLVAELGDDIRSRPS
jgi:acetoacetate decarboxylase